MSFGLMSSEDIDESGYNSDSSNGNDPAGDDGKKLIKAPHCKLVDHLWETCISGNYVESSGVLFRRSCFLCSKKFQPGTMKQGMAVLALENNLEKAKGMYWVTRVNTVSHCTQCRLCLCKPCLDIFNIEQGLLDDRKSPRKKKQNCQFKYSG